ncbi:MAG: sigma-70 family RNA polymerase sigma factor [Clostridia bacterium]|nr:sigma-70 family RNA polymerase sigma factor [Clostridia bacterium]
MAKNESSETEYGSGSIDAILEDFERALAKNDNVFYGSGASDEDAAAPQQKGADEAESGIGDDGGIGEAELVGDTSEPLTLFLSDIRKYKILDKEEEIELFKRARAGDAEARDMLVKSNQRLVLAIAWREFRGRGVSVEDLVAEGNVGLMTGIDKFDPSRGTRLSTYASFFIKREMRRAIYQMGDVIKIPENMHLLMTRIKTAESSFKAEKGSYPTVEDIGELTGIDTETVRELLFYKTLQFVDLDAPAGDDTDATNGERVSDEDGAVITASAEEIVERHLQALDGRMSRIIKAYYGLVGEKKKNLKDLSREFGLSEQRISQMKNRAERKLEKSGMIDELRALYQ